MNGIVIYRSSYGSTKQYAEWIAEEAGFSTYDSRDRAIPWDEAETIVIGCPIIANKPFLAGWLEKNWDRMKDKNVVLFTTSGADPAHAPVQEWIEASISEAMRSAMAVFPLAGRFRFADMNGLHKAMLRIGAILFRSDDIKNQIKNPVDGVSKESLSELLVHVRQVGGGMGTEV